MLPACVIVCLCCVFALSLFIGLRVCVSARLVVCVLFVALIVWLGVCVFFVFDHCLFIYVISCLLS